MEKYDSFEKQLPQESLKDFQQEIQKLQDKELKMKKADDLLKSDAKQKDKDY